MFGMGGTEILVILIVALLFLGPDKLPEAAKQISKGIRDIKKQSRVLQRTIEDDEHIGGAIRDLRSALRGEDEPVRPKPVTPPRQLVEVTSSPAVPTPPAAALPEPGSPVIGDASSSTGSTGSIGSIAGSASASVIVAAGLETTTGEPTLRGVVAPAPPEPGSAEPSESRSPAFSPFSSGASSGEETLRGVLAPRPPADGAEATEATATSAREEPRPARLTMPPVAGETDGAAPTARDDAELAALVKPAPHTIPRSSSPSSPPPSPPVASAAESARSEATASSESSASGEPDESKHG
ncbi:MAG TPA: twin-arginine translocase TatA/TatE family subunit [Kofleriaceae bacterium]|nr:twin-arginine translocase TatA/TatE family subunit [Kofleriaceae bacterium]